MTDMTIAGKPEDLSLDSLRSFRILATSSSPVIPLSTPSERFKPITEHETLKDWLDSYGTDLLYIYGSPRLAEDSDHIVQSLVEGNKERTIKDLILTFSFSKDDDRRNTITGMLTALLAQAFLHVQNMTDFLVFEQLAFYRSYTQIELTVLFNTVSKNFLYF